MSDNVPYREDVTRGELRHAMRGYNAMGYPPAGYVPAGNGMVTIIIMAPPATQIPDWRTGAFQQPPAQLHGWSLPAFDWRHWVRLLCIIAIVGAASYIGYGMATGGAGAKLPDAASAVHGWLADSPLQQPVKQESDGWTWPPRNPVGDAIDGTMQIVTWLVYAVIALAVLSAGTLVVGIVSKHRR